MNSFKKITVNRKAEDAVKSGHPWVYAAETVSSDESINNGDIVNVFSSKNRYLGSGFYNNNSKILVRILSDNANEVFGDAFFARRVRYAIAYRKTVMGENFSSCRLIFGDSDGLPGLIADKFGDVISVQIMCLGIEIRKHVIFDEIIKTLREYGETVTAVYERADTAVRVKEGLELYKAYYASPLLLPPDEVEPSVKICENGIIYDVDYINGQKTGFFLDQKYNRKAAGAIAKGKKVLDCFTHTGAFALNCAKAGADSVTAVDISEEAIEKCRTNAALNSLDNISFICADVFKYLTELYNSGEHSFDYIILDPPAFTKSRTTVAGAYKGYKEINLKAMRLLPRGGYLATCSCSHFMTDALFRKMLTEAAADAKVQLRIAEYRQQACDHPVLLTVPETEYLKFYIIQVV